MMSDDVLKRIRFEVDVLDNKIKEHTGEIGYPLHYELHQICKKIYKILDGKEGG